MAIDVFISYSHHNRSFAEKLQLKLHHAGIKDTWMDNRIPNGAFWRPEIDRNLDAASLIVVVVSPKSMKSAYVTYEWCYSWFKRKKELYDLYWIYLLECKNKVGMFGRITDDSQLDIDKCFNGRLTNKDWTFLIKDITDRLSLLQDLDDARDVLLNRHKTTEQKKKAAEKLAQSRYDKYKACSYLIEAMKPQLDSNTANGEAQQAIVSALQAVGDLRAIPYLLRLQTFTDDSSVLRTVESALKELIGKYT